MELLLRIRKQRIVLCTFRAPVLQRFYVHHGMVYIFVAHLQSLWMHRILARQQWNPNSAPQIFTDESFVFVHVIYLALD